MSDLRLLLVEDSAVDAELIARTLRLAGCALTYARVETSDAMRAALGREAWDLVIADFSLPRFDGLAALRPSGFVALRTARAPRQGEVLAGAAATSSSAVQHKVFDSLKLFWSQVHDIE